MQVFSCRMVQIEKDSMNYINKINLKKKNKEWNLKW